MSARSRVCSLDEALGGTADGARVGIGGVLGRRRPLAACQALAATGCRDLHVWSFLAGAELEALAGCTASVTSGYLDPQADAPETRRARDAGRVAWREVSEQLFVGGLLAAGHGLPFWPTTGAVGSALVDELGLREVACPYTGRPVLAAPATPLDLVLLHADAATAAGAVFAPEEREFLDDGDVALARAAARVVVTVDRIAADDEAAGGRRGMLAPFEVAAVVPLDRSPRSSAAHAAVGRPPAGTASLAPSRSSIHNSPVRRVCWALAQECRADDVVIVGVATPLAATAALLARRLLVPGLTVVLGGAVDPTDLDIAALVLEPSAAARRAPTVLGQRDLLGLLQRGSFTLQFVSPAQVDADGAINASRVRTADGWRGLPGCLALPDTAVLAGRLVAYRVEGGDRFCVPQVDYVTGLGADEGTRRRWSLPGRGVVAVVTEHGRRSIPSGETRPLDDVPPEVDALLDNELDRHGLLDLETRSGRASARAVLEALATP